MCYAFLCSVCSFPAGTVINENNCQLQVQFFSAGQILTRTIVLYELFSPECTWEKLIIQIQVWNGNTNSEMGCNTKSMSLRMNNRWNFFLSSVKTYTVNTNRQVYPQGLIWNSWTQQNDRIHLLDSKGYLRKNKILTANKSCPCLRFLFTWISNGGVFNQPYLASLNDELQPLPVEKQAGTLSTQSLYLLT